jgi:Fe-S-cluster containining protein
LGKFGQEKQPAIKGEVMSEVMSTVENTTGGMELTPKEVVKLQALLFLADTTYERLVSRAEEQGKRVTCKATGCTACCYDATIGTDAEMRLILWAIGRLTIEQQEGIKERLGYWKAVQEEAGNKHLVMESEEEAVVMWASLGEEEVAAMVAASWKHKASCALLSSEGTCLIYPQRPLSCRFHNSIDPPEMCAQKYETGSENQMIWVGGGLYRFQQVIQNSGFPLYPMGELSAMLIKYLL